MKEDKRQVVLNMTRAGHNEKVIQKNVKQTQIIAVTSGKGGVGKSTISVNMALSLQELNKKVLLIDADIHLGNVDLILGLRPQYTMEDVMVNDTPLHEIILHGPRRLDILPASSASMDIIETEDLFLRKLSQAFAGFAFNYDYIIIDTGAGIARNVLAFLLGADKIVVVLTPDPASITDAYAVIKVVRSVNKDIPVFMVANMVNSADEGEILFKKMNLMVQKFLNGRIILGGSILKDDMVTRSVKTQQPFVLAYPNGSASNAIKILNRRVLHGHSIQNPKGNNLFDRLRNNKKIQFEWNL